MDTERKETEDDKERKGQFIIVDLELKEEHKKLPKEAQTPFHNFKEFTDFYNSLPKIKREKFKKITLNFVEGSFEIGKANK